MDHFPGPQHDLPRRYCPVCGHWTDRRFRNAAELLREVGTRFYLAVVLLEHGELLADERPDEAEPLLAEARETFERLEAAPWLDRLARLQGARMFAEIP